MTGAPVYLDYQATTPLDPRAREARRKEHSASYLAVKAIEAMLHSRAEKRTAIRVAIAEADRGAFVSRVAMDT